MQKNKTKIIILVIFAIISIVVIFSLLPSDSDNEVDPELDLHVFEVLNENDDARTFFVDNTDVGYGNEDGVWATNQLSPSYSFGLRFENLSVPINATITTAYIRLYSISTPGLNNSNCNIYCDNTSDAENFTNIGVLNISGRNYTKNYTHWNETLAFGQWIKTPDLTPLVQEVIDKNNWTSGNSVAFLFVTNALRGYSATFQNFENKYPARLYLDWI